MVVLVQQVPTSRQSCIINNNRFIFLFALLTTGTCHFVADKSTSFAVATAFEPFNVQSSLFHRRPYEIETTKAFFVKRFNDRHDNQFIQSPSESSAFTLSKGENFRKLIQIHRLRGGGTTVALSNARNQQEDEETSLARAKQMRLFVSLTVFVILGALSFQYRTLWLPYMNKKYIQEQTLATLNQLKPDNYPKGDVIETIQALTIYMLGMAFWELLGMSTIPVETASGMVFGWFGAVPSIAGKLLGALIAFYSGRTFLYNYISNTSMLRNNQVFQLLNQQGVDGSKSGRTPFQTAFLMKFSCFPEFIKNFGSSLLPVIKPWMFFTVTLIHGGTFSLLWTWLGVDTAMRLNASTANLVLPDNYKLQIALIIAGFIGLVATPAVMAWWIRDLQKAVASNSTNVKPNLFQKIKRKLKIQ